MTNALTIIGNLTADLELRYSQAGRPFAGVTIADTPRRLNRDTGEWEEGETLFLRGTIGGDIAENAAASLRKGMRVIATGKLKQRQYKDNDGNDRTVVELDIDDISPSLRYAQASVTKVESKQGQQRPTQGQAPAQQQRPPQAAPAQAAPTTYTDDVPW